MAYFKNYTAFNICFKENYFHHSIEELKLNKYQPTNLPNNELVGLFKDFSHYLTAVDLLIASTLETNHRNEILEREIIPYFSNTNNMLDIGIGNGDLTMDFIKYFTNITVIDTDNSALANIPDIHPINNNKIRKINDSIVDIDLEEKFDLILFSHTLYYIESPLRTSLINNLYNMLNHKGLLLLIFNMGGSRFELTKHFGGKNFDFSELIQVIIDNYPNVNILESKETIRTLHIEPMLQIAGVCLKDANTSATQHELAHYLNEHHHKGNFYELDMIQEIILIGRIDIDAS